LSRPREFDPDVVLELAMRVFWRHGYHATSIDDLVRATAVSRSSLYATFGDKHALFVASIRRYADTNLAVLKRTLHAAERAIDGIRAVVETFATISSSEAGTMGCLLGTATLELLPHDAEVSTLVARCYTSRRKEFELALRRAQAQGDLRAEIDVAATAAYLVTHLQGMRMMGKMRPTRAHAMRAAQVAYAALRVVVGRRSA
jgi:TetR/AcrR family transcriptional regulator, transcriptional repressor for nem operon